MFTPPYSCVPSPAPMSAVGAHFSRPITPPFEPPVVDDVRLLMLSGTHKPDAPPEASSKLEHSLRTVCLPSGPRPEESQPPPTPNQHSARVTIVETEGLKQYKPVLEAWSTPNLDDWKALSRHNGLLALGSPSYKTSRATALQHWKLKRAVDLDHDFELDERAPALLGVGPELTVPALFWSNATDFDTAALNLALGPDGEYCMQRHRRVFLETARLRTRLYNDGAFVGWLGLFHAPMPLMHFETVMSWSKYQRKFSNLLPIAAFRYDTWGKQILHHK